MNDTRDFLPSWRPSPTRDALISFLDASMALPADRRVAAFDNDGTLWCERPTVVQYDFFVDALTSATASDPALRDRPEFAAVLDADHEAMSEIGLERLALAVVELFAGMEPDEFTRRVNSFMDTARNSRWGIPLRQAIYLPMLELLDELRRRDFTIFIVSGAGTEFVRAVSADLYGVAPECVVGTLIAYEFSRDAAGRPVLRRTAQLGSAANEGAAKVSHIQTQLGRRPILAAGNSGGDREMMEWACATGEPCLALLIDHDDEEREFRYVSSAATFDEPEPITSIGDRLGWTIVSIANDWETVFPTAPPHQGAS